MAKATGITRSRLGPFAGMTACDPTQKIRLVTNPVTGALEPQVLYNRKPETLPDNATRHQITIDAREGIEGVKRILLGEMTRGYRCRRSTARAKRVSPTDFIQSCRSRQTPKFT
ncbi:MAG: hypothetical protein JOY71_29645 [Acetobacteraceae bacterium]|nr:hypothetical protein [Acetobacteraceae bacterium]